MGNESVAGPSGPAIGAWHTTTMSVIETTVFDLAEGADEADLIEADALVQTKVAYQQPGLVRRTLARGGGRSWLVVTMWESDESADAAHEAAMGVPEVEAMLAHVDQSSIERRRFEALPG